ncbi:hypothetical protein [Streptomyces sp. NPDC004284]|uniref:hypothetical protein n=1 Tax=Streptomyces sp. NPDC004284 TaxID=3364695 RepID=UPI0036A85148
MSDMPADVRDEVIREVYRRIEEMDWDGMTSRQRTSTYDQWLEDPAIGGVLRRYRTPDSARYWLKDTPVKELPHARTGVGPYAKYVTSRDPSPSQIAFQAFGEGWSAEEGTLKIKPNKCLVRNAEASALMIWGDHKKLGALVWAGIEATVDGSPQPRIVATVPRGTRLSEGEKQRHKDLAGVAGIALVHISWQRVRL